MKTHLFDLGDTLYSSKFIKSFWQNNLIVILEKKNLWKFLTPFESVGLNSSQNQLSAHFVSLNIYNKHCKLSPHIFLQHAFFRTQTCTQKNLKMKEILKNNTQKEKKRKKKGGPKVSSLFKDGCYRIIKTFWKANFLLEWSRDIIQIFFYLKDAN